MNQDRCHLRGNRVTHGMDDERNHEDSLFQNRSVLRLNGHVDYPLDLNHDHEDYQYSHVARSQMLTDL